MKEVALLLMGYMVTLCIAAYSGWKHGYEEGYRDGDSVHHNIAG